MAEYEHLTVYSITEEPTLDIKLIREQGFGDIPDIYISNITDTAVDGHGNVYIADGEQLDIKVFNPEGNFLTTLGRKGEGPGEFLSIRDVQFSDGIIAVFDANLQQSVTFSISSMEYNRTIPIANNRNDFQELDHVYLSKYYMKSNYTFIMPFVIYQRNQEPSDWEKFERYTKVFILDKNGNVDSEKLFETNFPPEIVVPFNGLSIGMPVGLYNKLLFSLAPNEKMFLAQTEDFLIEVYSPNGDYLNAFYYPHRKISLTKETAVQAGVPEIFIENLHRIEHPESWYTLHDLLIDNENRLWVSTIVENFDVYEWWVLEETGELLAKFEWPRDEPIEVVKNGYMYTRETDSETGLQQVVRYRIEMDER